MMRSTPISTVTNIRATMPTVPKPRIHTRSARPISTDLSRLRNFPDRPRQPT